MSRQHFIVVACATLALTSSAFAQRSSITFVGFLNSGSPNERAHLVDAFRQGLREGGYVDGRNLAIEYRWAEGRPERLPQLATELINRNVALIAATGSLAPALAAKSVTKTIPIVFSGGEDPVKLGLVKSLNHPGGNVTGVSGACAALARKRLEILKDLLPGAKKIVYLANPSSPDAKASTYDVMAAAEVLRIPVDIVNASNETEIDSIFAAIKQMHADALLVSCDPLLTSRREQIVALAARYAIPASYAFRDFPMAGGLMSYGSSLADAYRQVGLYAARILNGTKPADLPVIQAAKLEFVVNLKTAKTLGLTISRDFLARVDEVIQ